MRLLSRGPFAWMVNIFKAMTGPKYNGKYLHKLIKDILGDTRLHDTLTSVVIPTFDIQNLQPAIFSSYQALVAISEVTKQVFKQNTDFFPIKPMDYGRLLVISIGTGSAKTDHRYNATMAAKWGVLGWLSNNGSTPLVDVFNQASADMVDVHLSVVFQALHSENNYLRIQDDSLSGTVSSVDVSTKENMKNLVQIGETSLKKSVSQVNADTGHSEPLQNGGTNEEAIKRI
ncbi:unnamed protein product [Camellia sinensis]